MEIDNPRKGRPARCPGLSEISIGFSLCFMYIPMCFMYLFHVYVQMFFAEGWQTAWSLRTRNVQDCLKCQSKSDSGGTTYSFRKMWQHVTAVWCQILTKQSWGKDNTNQSQLGDGCSNLVRFKHFPERPGWQMIKKQCLRFTKLCHVCRTDRSRIIRRYWKFMKLQYN